MRRSPSLLLLVLLLSGCRLTAPSATLPDPCALLTAAEVRAALDAAPQAPVGEHELLDAECQYDAQGAADASVLVELTTAGPDSATFAKRAAFFQTEGAQPIDGVGAAAFAKRGAILTQQPGVILFVILTDSRQDDPTILARAKVLAQLVLARLAAGGA